MLKLNRIAAFAAIAVLALSAISAAGPAPLSAASLPPAVVLTPVVTGLTEPTFVTNAGDGSGRLFILQRTGQIKIYKTGSLLSTPFLDVSGISDFTDAGSEQGLLGVAFDPDYSSNGLFYVTYAITTGDATFPYAVRLARYQVSGNADVANAASAFTILEVPKKYTNHNGGMLAFGPDGYLYWGTGDGGSGGDPDNNAQNIRRLLGKILRLDVRTTPPAGNTYVIPPTNPFYNKADPTIRKEIWAYGVRNPWRFSFDHATGDLYIGDVGQDREEEIDFQPAAAIGVRNYGWHTLEGKLCYSPMIGCVKPPHYVAPVAVYLHGAGDSFGCSVTGGYVYRGSASPTLAGVYFYGDFCSGKLLALVRNSNGTWSSKLVASTPYNISAFGQDEQGELYIVDYGGGQIVHISQVTVLSAGPFYSDGSLDGTVTETRELSGRGGTMDSTSPTLTVGDTATRQQRRATLSFDTSSLPDNAVVLSAVVSVKRAAISSVSPFAVLGRLKVNLAAPYFGTSPSLEPLDFQAPASVGKAGRIRSTAVPGWYAAALTPAAQAAINRTGLTQLRLRFALDDSNDSTANYISFFSGDAPTSADRPQLNVQYYLP